MLTQLQKDSFARDGFLLVPQVLTPEQVAELRGTLQSLFARPSEERGVGDTGHILMDIYSRHPSLQWLLFHEPMLQALRDLLGEDFRALRESAAHFNNFGGWHKDTMAQEKAGRKFQWESDYLMVEAGFYLQDNSREFGGGLDVVPGSQAQSEQFAAEVPRIARWMGKKPAAKPIKDCFSVPNRAGDLVIFDFRINHRATPHQVKVLPPEREKLAIFMACSRNNSHVAAYHEFIGGRPGYEYLRDSAYPKELLQSAQARGVHLE